MYDKELSITSSKAGVAVVGIGAVVAFAYLETLYLYLQDSVAARVRLIENFLDQSSRGRVPTQIEEYRFGISSAFRGKYRVNGVARALIGRPHIYVMHITLIAGLIAVALFVGT